MTINVKWPFQVDGFNGLTRPHRDLIRESLKAICTNYTNCSLTITIDFYPPDESDHVAQLMDRTAGYIIDNLRTTRTIDNTVRIKQIEINRKHSTKGGEIHVKIIKI
jgi:hypothetical protein